MDARGPRAYSLEACHLGAYHDQSTNWTLGKLIRAYSPVWEPRAYNGQSAAWTLGVLEPTIWVGAYGLGAGDLQRPIYQLDAGETKAYSLGAYKSGGLKQPGAYHEQSTSWTPGAWGTRVINLPVGCLGNQSLQAGLQSGSLWPGSLQSGDLQSKGRH